MRLLDEKESLEKPTPVQPRANNFRDWMTNIMGRAGDEEGGEGSSAGPDGQPFEMPDESGAVRPAADQLAEATAETNQVSQDVPKLFSAAAECASQTV